MYLPKLSNQEIDRYHSKSPVEPAANGHNGVFTPTNKHHLLNFKPSWPNFSGWSLNFKVSKLGNVKSIGSRK